MCNRIQLFSSLSYNLESNLSLNLLVKVDGSGVLTGSLNCLGYDCLAVNLKALSSESLSNLSSTYATENCAVLVNLSRDANLNAVQLSSQSLSISLDLGELVSALTLVLCQNLLS